MRSCRTSPRGIARSRVKPASLRPFISIGARVAGSNGERTARIHSPRFVSTPRPMNREFLVLHRRFESESSCRIYRETNASLTGPMMLFLPREASVPSVPLLFSFFQFPRMFFSSLRAPGSLSHTSQSLRLGTAKLLILVLYCSTLVDRAARYVGRESLRFAAGCRD